MCKCKAYIDCDRLWPQSYMQRLSHELTQDAHSRVKTLDLPEKGSCKVQSPTNITSVWKLDVVQTQNGLCPYLFQGAKSKNWPSDLWKQIIRATCFGCCICQSIHGHGCKDSTTNFVSLSALVQKERNPSYIYHLQEHGNRNIRYMCCKVCVIWYAMIHQMAFWHQQSRTCMMNNIMMRCNG